MKSLRVVAICLWLVCFAIVAVACDGDDGNEITVSGTIEAQTVTVAVLGGGRVSEVLVEDGDRVAAGDVLARLDTSLIDAQLSEVEATLDMAQAQLDQVTSVARPEELQAAEAALAQAVAQWNGARKAWENARVGARDQQELGDQLTEASIQVSLAEVRVDGATDGLTTAQARRDRTSGTGSDAELAEAQLDAATAVLAQAQAGLDGAKRTLASLLEMRDNPIGALAQVNVAESAYHQTEAAVEAAQARLDLLKAGAAKEEVAAAQAQVEQAQAALAALQAQHADLTLVAAIDGLILSRAIEPGEIARPGAALFEVGNLATVKVTVFVPEADIATVGLGQKVDVAVDAFPDDTFQGEVSFISSQAEFTPRNVQTEAQRANLVFAVTVVLDNADRRLRPGMPADAIIKTG